MNKPPHRFFRAMVLMSSGVAIGCGGMSARDGENQPSPSGESGSSSGGSGGAIARGGAIASGGGDSGGVSSQGGSAGAELSQPGPFACPPARWDCSSSTTLDCYGADLGGWELPNDCACDDSRPNSLADCDPGESFVCREATSFNGGTPLAEAIPFECSCLPTQDSCEQACVQFMPGYYIPECSEDPNTILCGCGFVYLK